MITLKNDKLSIKVSERGAELQSLKYQGLEYLWQADPAYWAKHSPVLFPIVGELKEGKYFFEGKEYKLSRHGFARDKVFEPIQTSDLSVQFTLKSDESSYKLYPFRFIFRVLYRLEKDELFCTYMVDNTDIKTMYFSAGGHPAFNVPLEAKPGYSDYKLKFNNDTALKRYLLVNGLTADDTETIALKNHELQLQTSLFYSDAIVLKNINSSEVELTSVKGIHGLRFAFYGFPFFGIWSVKDAPFVCLEPWCGIADHINHDQQLTRKEGINALEAGGSWERTWSVKLF